ncbi:MAG: chemotaxis protein CheW [Acidobacteriota bacterium]|nr:chemotaxis protein CheW [Acidobacteriota bacterium]
MVDLVKIRKKKAQQQADERNAGVPPAGPAASPPPALATQEPQYVGSLLPKIGGEDAAEPAGETPALHLETPALPSKLETFKAEAGKRRAFETGKSNEAAESQLELLTFVIAGEQYAVDIERIVEIVTPRAVTRIPNADSSVVGIISLRGTIVTLVDVRRKLRHREAGDANDDTRIVVIDFQHEIVGFIVDRVLRVVKAVAGDIERHPVVHATELDDSVRGVFRAAGALTILLDLDKLLDHGGLAVRSA